ncbi:MAG: HEAT repeat domain-containing protein [Planctomycetaceae bacterium]|nr:HEAT repeat domain-containing protein [Planctomycetaceae bacterium]
MTCRSSQISGFHVLVQVAALLIFLPDPASAQNVFESIEIDTLQQAVESQSELPNPEFSPTGPFQGPLKISHIARFNALPMRMFLEPRLISPGTIYRVDESFVELFDKTLREFDDDELLETAALGLARIAREKLNNISRSTDVLLKHLQSHTSLRVRFACARALVNADVSASAAAVLELNEHAEDSQRLWIDAALARWKVTAAGDVWRQRLADDSETAVGVSLACAGLAALGDVQALDLLLSVLRGKLLAYDKRRAAAKAICTLVPDVALAESAAFTGGNVLERLLGIELLRSSSSEAHARLIPLYADPSDGVASAAWTVLHKWRPDLLIPEIATGRSHRDAAVRMTAARIMGRFPDAERSGWLHQQLSDRHLEVRNVAREMLFLVAEEQAPLRDGIIAMAGDTLGADSEDWQAIEQCLLLLGQLRAAQFSPRCIPLLEHPRNEVLVTSAWFLHLFPDPAVEHAVSDRLTQIEAISMNPVATSTNVELGLQASYLIQYAGLMRMTDLQPMLEANFRKTLVSSLIFKRAAAMWTLGLFHEKDPVPALQESLVSRVVDRDGQDPELLEVRRMAVVALGLIRAKSAIPVLLEAYKVDPAISVIPDSARWSLGMLGNPVLDPVKPYAPSIGGWRLSPVPDQ